MWQNPASRESPIFRYTAMFDRFLGECSGGHRKQCADKSEEQGIEADQSTILLTPSQCQEVAENGRRQEGNGKMHEHGMNGMHGDLTPGRLQGGSLVASRDKSCGYERIGKTGFTNRGVLRQAAGCCCRGRRQRSAVRNGRDTPRPRRQLWRSEVTAVVASEKSEAIGDPQRFVPGEGEQRSDSPEGR